MVDVAAAADVPEGGTLVTELGEYPICLVNTDGRIHAVHNTCTHALAAMDGGWVEDGCIECPRHGARFDLTTGEALTPPASLPLPVFRVEITDGRVLVDPTPSHPHPLLQRDEYGASRG